MNLTPEQFRTHCLQAAQKAKQDGYPNFAEGILNFANGGKFPSDTHVRPTNDAKVLADLNRSRRLREVVRF